MALSYREAFLRQASADFQMALSSRNSASTCYFLHFLQMATEKLARAEACDPDEDHPPPRTHKGFLRFVRVICNDPIRRGELGYDGRAGWGKLQRLVPLAESLEKLAPKLAGDGPNTEYPWRNGNEIAVPADFSFGEFGPHRRPLEMNLLLEFLSRCMERLE